MRLLSLLCALWFALMSGFFFAFSSTVMPGLALMPDEPGMRAMQAINIAVANPLFAAGFWVALLLAVVSGGAALALRRPGWMFLLGGCLIYVAGAFLTTAGGNVPLNRALEVLSSDSPEGAAAWASYQPDWTFLNHIRMAAAFLAAAVVLVPFAHD